MDKREDQASRPEGHGVRKDIFVRNLDQGVYRTVRAKAVERGINMGDALNDAMNLWIREPRRWRASNLRTGHEWDGVAGHVIPPPMGK